MTTETAWYRWLDGHHEGVEVVGTWRTRVQVAWPESARTVEGSDLFPPLPPGLVEVIRPESWVDAARLFVSCSADGGANPASGCDELAAYGDNYCDAHVIVTDEPNEAGEYRGSGCDAACRC